jgi:signal transduction histidine kinase
LAPVLFSWLALFLGLLMPPCVWGQTPGVAGSTNTKRVLLIFTEARDLPGNVLLEQSARAAMRDGSTNAIEFYTESMDAARFPNSRHYRIFREYIKNKYAGQSLDLIITFVGRDFQAVRELPTILATNVPSVVVGVNDLELPLLENRPYTGVFHRFDVAGTVNFILHLQPETRRVVVVGGTAANDRAVLASIEETARSVDGVTFEFWTNRPVAAIYEAAQKLPEGTVLLMGSMQRDFAGQPAYTSQILQLLASTASVPVYVLADGLIGNGALGGDVVELENVGAGAGKLALRVLSGTPVGQLPIEVESNGVPMADWRALQRWHIKPSRLPAHCIIRYEPLSLWATHGILIVCVAAGLLAQAITIAALLVQRKGQRSAEAEILRQRSELAHVARVSMMGQLASALTHELNQPLGAILRNAEAAEIFLQSPHPDLEEVRAILTDIRRDDKRAGDVIDRMRSLFKRQTLTSSRLDLRDLAEDTIAMAKPDAVARRVRLRLELPPELPEAQGDRVHIQQVLLNLILNGMDAMTDTPRPRRELLVRVAKTKNDNLLISVADRGSGISPENAAHVFEPFFTTKPNGMGMGLAISKTIIEAHGGELWMSSNAAEGTTFYFVLPAAGFYKVKPGDLPAAL